MHCMAERCEIPRERILVWQLEPPLKGHVELPNSAFAHASVSANCPEQGMRIDYALVAEDHDMPSVAKRRNKLPSPLVGGAAPVDSPPPEGRTTLAH